MTTENNEPQLGASSIEDLEVKDSSEVRGGQNIGVGELQETTISKPPSAGASSVDAQGRLLMGTDSGIFR